MSDIGLSGIVRVGNTLWNLNNILNMWAVTDDAVMVVYNQIRVTAKGHGEGDTEPYQEMIQGERGRALAAWIKAQPDQATPPPKVAIRALPMAGVDKPAP